MSKKRSKRKKNETTYLIFITPKRLIMVLLDRTRNLDVDDRLRNGSAKRKPIT